MVAYNRDFEGSEADPENKAREEVRCTADDVVAALAEGGLESASWASATTCRPRWRK